jgi:hypothetical protein
MLKGEAKKIYQREYMRRRRAAARKFRDKPDDVAALKRRIRELEHELSNRQEPKAERPSPSAPQKPLRPDREEMAARMRADFEAYDRERAQWGGRPKSLVIDDINRLLSGRLRCSDDVRQIIVDALAPHVRNQANIERGIPRRTYRKVWAALHTDQNPAAKAAFIAFTALDGTISRIEGGTVKHTPNPNTIVIADDKVRSMSDLRRKRQEQSERARAKRQAAKRKQVR